MDAIRELIETKRSARKSMERGLGEAPTARQRRNWRKGIKQNDIEIAALEAAAEQIQFAIAMKRGLQKVLSCQRTKRP